MRAGGEGGGGGGADLADIAVLALLLGVLEGGDPVAVRHGRRRREGSSASAWVGSRGVSSRSGRGGVVERRGCDGEGGHAGEADSALNRCRRRFLFRSVFYGEEYRVVTRCVCCELVARLANTPRVAAGHP
jgi:hypothetical protein